MDDSLRVEDISRLLSEENSSRISVKLKELGFKWLSADLDGYRQGSLTMVLEIRK